MKKPEIVFIVEEERDGYVAEALGHAIVTQGQTLKDVRSMVRRAVRCHFGGQEGPVMIRLRLDRMRRALKGHTLSFPS